MSLSVNGINAAYYPQRSYSAQVPVNNQPNFTGEQKNKTKDYVMQGLGFAAAAAIALIAIRCCKTNQTELNALKSKLKSLEAPIKEVSETPIKEVPIKDIFEM